MSKNRIRKRLKYSPCSPNIEEMLEAISKEIDYAISRYKADKKRIGVSSIDLLYAVKSIAAKHAIISYRNGIDDSLLINSDSHREEVLKKCLSELQASVKSIELEFAVN